MINVKELNVKFGIAKKEIHAVKDVSFEVERGGSLGIVGESGSGKSTVLRAICGLNYYTGEIEINNTVVRRKRKLEIKKLMQMVFQDPYGSLHPRHCVNDTLKEPLNTHRFDAKAERIIKMLDQVGLGNRFRFCYPHQMSGGQRQRVAVARALIIEPKILLLDEPTSALDISVQSEILNLLVKIRKDLDLTYVMVSHDLAVISHICDTIIVMSQGCMVEKLTTEKLRSGNVENDYTKQLLKASKGYDRAIVDNFKDFT
jgi:peptide/nickel transport system ATP-binding protein